MQLAGERRAVGIVAAADQGVGLRGDDLVDDRTEIRGRAAIGLVEYDGHVLLGGEVRVAWATALEKGSSS